MARTTDKSKKIPKSKVVAEKKVEEPVEAPVEENLEVHSSASESDSESELDDEIEGLSDEDSSDKHKVKKLNKKRKSTETNSKTKDEYSNIIYVSRLPHGFHEKELSKYFSQFGDLKEVRLARNKKSGNSRHYGFVQFANKEDAAVAQESMNNYLLMGHLLQVRLLGKGSKIEKLYKYKKRAYIEANIKKSVEELKESATKKHEERINKLSDAGIQFKW